MKFIILTPTNLLRIFILQHTSCWVITKILLRKTETLIDTSEEAGLEINVQKTRYTLLSRHQNAGQNHDL
jgi:hypothetical protein